MTLLQEAASNDSLTSSCISVLSRTLLRNTRKNDHYSLLKQARQLGIATQKELEEKMGTIIRRLMGDLGKRIQTKTYRQGTFRIQPYPKANGGKRPILIANNFEDLIVQLSVKRTIAPELGKKISTKISYCGVPRGKIREERRNVLTAIAAVSKKMAAKKIWILKADIEKFFDTLDRKIVFDQLKENLSDESLLGFFKDWMNYVTSNPNLHRELQLPTGIGVPQGSCLSSLIANLYLKDFDAACDISGLTAVRYADDLLFVCDTKLLAERLKGYIVSHCADLKLSLKKDKKKTDIFSSDDAFVFLGYERKENKWAIPDDTQKKWMWKIKQNIDGFFELAKKLKRRPFSREEMDTFKQLVKRIESQLRSYGLLVTPKKYLDGHYHSTVAHEQGRKMAEFLAMHVGRINKQADTKLLSTQSFLIAKKRGSKEKIPLWPYVVPRSCL